MTTKLGRGEAHQYHNNIRERHTVSHYLRRQYILVPAICRKASTLPEELLHKFRRSRHMDLRMAVVVVMKRKANAHIYAARQHIKQLLHIVTCICNSRILRATCLRTARMQVHANSDINWAWAEQRSYHTTLRHFSYRH